MFQFYPASFPVGKHNANAHCVCAPFRLAVLQYHLLAARVDLKMDATSSMQHCIGMLPREKTKKCKKNSVNLNRLDIFMWLINAIREWNKVEKKKYEVVFRFSE